MTDDVRIGLIGAGRIARVHAEAYRGVARGRITACTDPVESAARDLGRDYGYEIATDFDAILGDSDIDAVLIATPNDLPIKRSPRYRRASTCFVRSRSR